MKATTLVCNLINNIRGKSNWDHIIREIYYKNKLLTDSNEIDTVFGRYLTTAVSDKIASHFKNNWSIMHLQICPWNFVEVIQIINNVKIRNHQALTIYLQH